MIRMTSMTVTFVSPVPVLIVFHFYSAGEQLSFSMSYQH